MCFFLNLSSFVYGELGELKNGATHAYFIKSLYVWPDGGLVSEGGRRRPLTYLLAQREVHRLAIAAHAVQHACLDAAATHGPLTQLAGAPVWRRDKMPLVSTLAC